VASGGLAAGVLLAAVLTLKDVVLEEWRLHRMSIPSRRESAFRALLESGSPRVVTRLLAKIADSARRPDAPPRQEVWFDHSGKLYPRGKTRLGLESWKFHLFMLGDPFYVECLLKFCLEQRNHAFEPLLSGATSSRPYIRYLSTLLVFLDEEHRPQVIPLLKNALGDRDPWVRAAALGRWIEEDWPLECGAIPQAIEGLRGLKIQADNDVFRWLADGFHLCPELLPALVAVLGDEDRDLRSWALLALCAIGQEAREAVSAIESRLGDPEDCGTALLVLCIILERDWGELSRQYGVDVNP
jgi:hypothetical protein